MRKDITVEVSAADRARLEAVVADRNSPRKHVWRAKPFVWTADPDKIIAAVKRGHQALDPIHYTWIFKRGTTGPQQNEYSVF